MGDAYDWRDDARKGYELAIAMLSLAAGYREDAMGKKWSMVIKENPVLAARIAAHEKRRAALAAQSEAEPSASEGAEKGEVNATPEKHSHAESRSGLEVRPGRGGVPEQFDPTRVAVKVKGLSAVIEHAKRIKDWPRRDDAIECLIDEQQAFVTWWDVHVSPGGEGGDRKSADHGPKNPTVISADDAKSGTGIDKRQVSKWRQRLADIESYRTDLRRAVWRWAWSGKRGGRVIGEHGAEIPPDLRVGDFRVVFDDIHDGSVDLIFTDPPYDKDHVPLYGDLAEFGARVLKPGGSLIAYCGHYAIPDICDLVRPHMRWHWLLADGHDGGRYVCLPGAGVKVGWKPILWLTNGQVTHDRDIVMDCFWSKPPDKDSDSWSQSLQLAEYYIRALTDIDGMVIDPFAGCCTTLMAARNTGRRAIGAEIDPEVAAIAAARLEGEGNGRHGVLQGA